MYEQEFGYPNLERIMKCIKHRRGFKFTHCVMISEDGTPLLKKNAAKKYFDERGYSDPLPSHYESMGKYIGNRMKKFPFPDLNYLHKWYNKDLHGCRMFIRKVANKFYISPEEFEDWMLVNEIDRDYNHSRSRLKKEEKEEEILAEWPNVGKRKDKYSMDEVLILFSVKVRGLLSFIETVSNNV